LRSLGGGGDSVTSPSFYACRCVAQAVCGPGPPVRRHEAWLPGSGMAARSRDDALAPRQRLEVVSRHAAVRPRCVLRQPRRTDNADPDVRLMWLLSGAGIRPDEPAGGLARGCGGLATGESAVGLAVDRRVLNARVDVDDR
jgi:hypothetical protein